MRLCRVQWKARGFGRTDRAGFECPGPVLRYCLSQRIRAEPLTARKKIPRSPSTGGRMGRSSVADFASDSCSFFSAERPCRAEAEVAAHSRRNLAAFGAAYIACVVGVRAATQNALVGLHHDQTIIGVFNVLLFWAEPERNSPPGNTR